MKSLFKIGLSIMLLFSFIGCSNNTSTPAETDTTNSASSANSEGEGKQDSSIILKSSVQAPPAAPYAKGFDVYLDEIEKRSEGRLQFERYYSESLAKASNKLSALSSGIADIAIFVPTYTPGQLPLAGVGSNPTIWEDSWVGAKAFNELYHTIPAMQEEMEKENVKWVGQYALPSYYIISTKPVSSFEDLQGLRIIATGQQAVLLQELGATPVGMPITDSYDALSRGTVDGAIYGLTSGATYGLEESAKYIWKLPVGSPAGLIGMNKDTWDSLPEDIQAIIEDVAANYHPEAYHNVYQIEGDGEALNKFIDAGVEIIEASNEDIQKLKDIARETIWEQWIEEQEANGLPGEEVLNTFVQLVEKYEKENPFK